MRLSAMAASEELVVLSDAKTNLNQRWGLFILEKGGLKKQKSAVPRTVTAERT